MLKAIGSVAGQTGAQARPDIKPFLVVSVLFLWMAATGTATAEPQTYPEQNPLRATHCWRLDGDALDAISGTNGINQGIYQTLSLFGTGQSMAGGGMEDRVFDTQLSMWSPTNAFTITFWANLRTYGALLLGACDGKGDNSMGMYVRLHTDKELWWQLGGTATARTRAIFTSPLSCVDGKWHHFAFVHTTGVRATNLAVYVDGVMLDRQVDEDTAIGYHAPDLNLSFLGLWFRASSWTKALAGPEGNIDDILIFPSALERWAVTGFITGEYSRPGTLLVIH